MYVRVCQECVDEHQDIINKKISKGSVWGANLTDDKDECYLSYMHDEVKEVVGAGRMKINYYQEKGLQHITGNIDMEGFTSLTALLEAKRFVTIEQEGIDSTVNVNKITWACKVKEEKE